VLKNNNAKKKIYIYNMQDMEENTGNKKEDRTMNVSG
jgi:hypothetical protein